MGNNVLFRERKKLNFPHVLKGRWLIFSLIMKMKINGYYWHDRVKLEIELLIYSTWTSSDLK